MFDRNFLPDPITENERQPPRPNAALTGNYNQRVRNGRTTCRNLLDM